MAIETRASSSEFFSPKQCAIGDNWEKQEPKLMICCLNPHCPQENPACPDGTRFCSSCGTELVLLSNRYRPIKRLGIGGFGITYLAEDNDKFQKQCVIKQLTLQLPDARRLFEDEARRLEDLDDFPAIPRLLAYPSDVNYLYLVQEFVAGQDLSKELQHHPGGFDEAYVKEFLQAILPILERIHARVIIHRDIKLDNIMRRPDNQLVLIDFGIAKVIPANNTLQPGTRAGTDGYAAPEQMKVGLATAASDLYSVGAACFHLLTDMNPADVFMEYGYQWPTKWQQYLKRPVSKELRDIIDRLLKYEYQERFQSATAVLNALHQAPIKKEQAVPFRMLLVIGVFSTLIVAAIWGLLSSINQKPNVSVSPSIADYTPTAKITLKDAAAYIDRGFSRSKSGDKKGAIEDYSLAIQLKPNSAAAYYNRGVVRSELGDKTGAIEDYTKSIQFNPNDADTFYNRGVVRKELGDKSGAIEDYTEAIRLQPNYASAYNNRGTARSNLSDNKGALEDYNQALQLKPDYPFAYYNRGLVRSKLGDKTGAIDDYTKAIKYNSEDADAFYNRGVVRGELGNKAAAVEDYTQAIKLKPDYANAYYNRGGLRSKLGDKTGAIEDYTKSIQYNPDDADAYNYRGNAWSELGDKKEAIADFNKAAALYQKQGKDKDKYYQYVLRRLQELER